MFGARAERETYDIEIIVYINNKNKNTKKVLFFVVLLFKKLCKKWLVRN